MNDPLYGQIVFDSPLINKIILLPIIQRLRTISQNGVYGLQIIAQLNNNLYPTRFDHSIGVAYLCQLFGVSENIQILLYCMIYIIRILVMILII